MNRKALLASIAGLLLLGTSCSATSAQKEEIDDTTCMVVRDKLDDTINAIDCDWRDN